MLKSEKELISLNLNGEIIQPAISSNIGSGETIKLKAGKSFKLHLRNQNQSNYPLNLTC